MGLDMAELDCREREGARLRRLPHPERPGDKASMLYVTATEDPVEPGRWHLDPWHLCRYAGLSAELTAAEVEAVTVANPGRQPWCVRPDDRFYYASACQRRHAA
jgi:hypothetical protein